MLSFFPGQVSVNKRIPLRVSAPCENQNTSERKRREGRTAAVCLQHPDRRRGCVLCLEGLKVRYDPASCPWITLGMEMWLSIRLHPETVRGRGARCHRFLPRARDMFLSGRLTTSPGRLKDQRKEKQRL